MPSLFTLMMIASLINICLYTWLAFTIGWYTIPVIIALHVAFYPLNKRLLNHLYGV